MKDSFGIIKPIEDYHLSIAIKFNKVITKNMLDLVELQIINRLRNKE
jgi:hypothetical protein